MISVFLWPMLHGLQLFWGNRNHPLNLKDHVLRVGRFTVTLHLILSETCFCFNIKNMPRRGQFRKNSLSQRTHADTQTRIHTHHHKPSPLHADTWSLQIIPAPPWLEKIRESWKMPLWKRNHLLTFAHFKRYYRCCDEVIECNANKHKKKIKVVWPWSYNNLKAPFITYCSPQSFIFMFLWVWGCCWIRNRLDIMFWWDWQGLRITKLISKLHYFLYMHTTV